jgi:hypothetical protein
VVGEASMKLKHGRIGPLIEQLAKAVNAAQDY